MMRYVFLVLLMNIPWLTAYSQTSTHDSLRQTNGIVVTTSSDYHPDNWTKSATGIKTIDGSGLEGKLDASSRFLIQATFGGNRQTVAQVAAKESIAPNGLAMKM